MTDKALERAFRMDEQLHLSVLDSGHSRYGCIGCERLKTYVERRIAEAVAAEREACVADAGDIWGDGEQLAKRRAFRARGGEKP